MGFGSEYSDDHVHFIAGGRTLAIVEQYIWDKEHAKEILQDLARDMGAADVIPGDRAVVFIFDQPTENPLLNYVENRPYKGKDNFYYEARKDTPEGLALHNRVNDVPLYELGFDLFAKRLTGAETVLANPDHLRENLGGAPGRYDSEYGIDAASYSKFGDTYVVSVPRVLRGVFNEASEKLSVEKRVPMAAGHTFEWFTPPDSQQIPYSKVIELREKVLGDQLKPAVVMKPSSAFKNGA